MNYEVINVGSSLIKRLSKLKSKKYRNETGTYLIEGEKLIKEALKSGVVIYCVFIDRELYNKSNDIARPFSENGIKIYITESAAIEKLSDTVSPQGIVCHACKSKELDFTGIDNNGLYIALEGLQDPGNIGTIIRTAEGFGLDGVIMDRNCADIYSPKVIRAAMGSSLRFPIYFTDDMPSAVKMLREAGLTVYAAAASVKGKSVTDAFNEEKGYAVIIGNEGNGITKNTMQACESTVFIPMKGITESFNAALAGAIIMWEMSK